jgi:hypothetical protein
MFPATNLRHGLQRFVLDLGLDSASLKLTIPIYSLGKVHVRLCNSSITGTR